MSEYLINSSTLTGIANAIRSKTGSTSAFTPAQMVTEINNISGGDTTVPPNAYNQSTITRYEGSETYILNEAFYNCTALTTVSFPNCSYIDTNAFYNCTALTTASFPKCGYIDNYVFCNCNLLSSLYLNQVSSVPTLSAINAFDNTPLSAGGSGKIYVPFSLYTAFRTATNWKSLAARIVGM